MPSSVIRLVSEGDGIGLMNLGSLMVGSSNLMFGGLLDLSNKESIEVLDGFGFGFGFGFRSPDPEDPELPATRDDISIYISVLVCHQAYNLKRIKVGVMKGNIW